MGLNTGDRILETTTTTSTGNITLAGAVTGYRAFSTVITANGDQFPYVIAGSSEWECGIGTRVSSTTFSRSPTASSNAGALVNFSAGTKEVWIDWTHAFINSMRADNIVINGGMEVDQANVGAAQTGVTITDRYAVDMFGFSSAGAVVVTLQQVSDAPAGLKKSVKVSVTTADASIAAGDFARLWTVVEGYRWARLGFGAASPQSISIGFWVKAHRTGTYTGSVTNGAQNRSYTFEYAVNAADTWEYKTVTVSGDTTGTWDSTTGAAAYVDWTMMSGSTFQTAAGSWAAGHFFATSNQINGVAATTDTFQITGVSLVSGSVPVSEAQSSLVVRPFDQELFLCKRYYQKSFDYDVVPAQNAGINNGDFEWTAVKAGAVAQRTAQVPLSPPMRTSGNHTYYNPSAANAFARDLDGGVDCSTTATVTAGKNSFTIAVTTNAATAVGNLMSVHWVTESRL